MPYPQGPIYQVLPTICYEYTLELKEYRERDPHRSDDAHLGLRAI